MGDWQNRFRAKSDDDLDKYKSEIGRIALELRVMITITNINVAKNWSTMP